VGSAKSFTSISTGGEEGLLFTVNPKRINLTMKKSQCFNTLALQNSSKTQHSFILQFRCPILNIFIGPKTGKQ
jgi:hypothetical protein